MMVQGTFIGDSLQPGVELLPSTLRMTRLRRVAPDGLSPEQPPEWTVVDFEADDGQADTVATAFARGLKGKGGWYSDFWVNDIHIVAFAGRVFRYVRGDDAGRNAAREYGELCGVPVHQLDWPD